MQPTSTREAKNSLNMGKFHIKEHTHKTKKKVLVVVKPIVWVQPLSG